MGTLSARVLAGLLAGAFSGPYRALAGIWKRLPVITAFFNHNHKRGAAMSHSDFLASPHYRWGLTLVPAGFGGQFTFKTNI